MKLPRKVFACLAAICYSLSGCYWRSTHVIPDRISAIPPKIRSIAIFPFADARTNPYHLRHFPAPSSELQEKLIARISGSPGLQIVEREQINKLLEEQKLQITGAVDDKSAVQMGKIMGVQAVLMGSINQYGRHWFTMPYVTTLITFRLVDVETGNILVSREVVANNVNMFYPYRNLRDSLKQAADAIARVINEAASKKF